MEIKTPEQILDVRMPVCCWHYGTCDSCKERYTLVLHINYDKAPGKDSRLCEKCVIEHLIPTITENKKWAHFKKS